MHLPHNNCISHKRQGLERTSLVACWWTVVALPDCINARLLPMHGITPAAEQGSMVETNDLSSAYIV